MTWGETPPCRAYPAALAGGTNHLGAPRLLRVLPATVAAGSVLLVKAAAHGALLELAGGAPPCICGVVRCWRGATVAFGVRLAGKQRRLL